MHRKTQGFFAAFLGFFGLSFSGCAPGGIGDPCTPEAIPTCGFSRTESYAETSSAQCRTRICLVYRLQGHPERALETSQGMSPTCNEPPDCRGSCPSISEVKERVFCSCRCRAGAEGTNLPLCNCTKGFHCVDLFMLGGPALSGGYCIPEKFCERDSDCGGGQTCQQNVCVGMMMR
ncbi:MAG: hypothetical protein RMJ84_02910 [Sandaracinaceae bacterium]|nr:hypothetical protein [Sandaracinaceae bacterium]